MLQTSHSKEQLMKIAMENYDKMVNFCKALASEGYWNNPYEILKKPIQNVLDLYVQSILINLSIYCGNFKEEEKQFIMEVTQTNAIGCTTAEELPDEVIEIAKKMVLSPPIILQLCGVRDAEKDSMFTGYFLDAILNIMLAMAKLDCSRQDFANKFIQEYYNKISAFLNQNQLETTINTRYLFKKLSSESFHKEKILRDRPSLKNEKPTFTEEELKELYEQNNIKIDKPDTTEVQKEKLETAEKELQDYQTEQIEKEIKEIKSEDKLTKLLDELNELIGLKVVKDEISSLINLIKVKKMREAYNMPSMDMTYHMVFTGNPGTGKTTVARLVAQIYKELGILSKGDLIETDRSGLVAGYVGQTAIKVKEVVQKATGGVLFIDEAYSLTNNGMANDFGGEVLDTLVKLMEDNRDDLVVIVAGYQKEMEAFLKANTGLVSRFNKFIDFPDYTLDELMSIMNSLAVKSGVVMEEEAVQILREDLANMSTEKEKQFGNGRGIRNTFEKIMVMQANRIVAIENPTQEQLTQIKKEDVEGIL